MSANQALVLFHKQLGDVLLLEPALAKLSVATGTEIMLATRPAFAPLLELMAHVRPMPPGGFRRATQVISFDPRSRACIQTLTTWSSSKKLIVATDKQLRAWHKIIFGAGQTVISDATCYRAQYFFDVMPCEAFFPFRPPVLRLPPADWLPQTLPESYVVLHVTSAWKRKSWSSAAWAKTLDELHAKEFGPFVVTGGGAEWEMAYVNELQALTKASLINYCGKTNLQAYLAIIAGAALVLCIDGSAAHVAAAFNRPSVVLFGPTHPLHWHFPGAAAVLVDARQFSDEERPAVDNIPASAVVAAVEQSVGCRA